MRAVFLDANVLFAAVASKTGGSYFILELAKRRFIEIITVVHALAEAERNIGKKLGDPALVRHYENLLAIKPRIQSLVGVSEDEEHKLHDIVPEKDMPIVLGAFLSGVEFLITLDRKHLFGNSKLKALHLPFAILTPGDFIQNHIL